MSKVWRATDTKTGKEVCLKVLDKEKTDLLLKRFRGMDRPDEGVIAMSLDHPNIVRTFEHGKTNKGEQYLVMEFVKGAGLNFLVDTKSSQLRGNEIDYLIQIGEAISYFHKQNYIHRDICPRNVMVSHEHVCKLIDFGLAVPNTPAFRKPGNRTGTVSYMAPELIRRGPTDQRIDIFSFAVTAFYTLTGGLPWDAAESLQSMLQHLNSPPKDVRELNPEVSDKVARIVAKGLERDPNERFQTMDHMIAALREV